MSQDELAKRLGLTSRSAISHIEKGINTVAPTKLLAYAKELNTTREYLIGESNGTKRLALKSVLDIEYPGIEWNDKQVKKADNAIKEIFEREKVD